VRWPRRQLRDARAVLERRYRRLLACYPPGYRETHEDEMLGVALAGSAPEQRWPRSGEAVRLIAGGMRTRLRLLPAGLSGPAWRDGAAAVTFLGALLLAAIHAQWVADGLALSSGVIIWPSSGANTVLAVFWLLAAVAVTLRWRWVAAAAALLAALGDVARVTVGGGAPFFLVLTWWQVVLAAVTAVAAVALLPGPPLGSRPLSRRVIATVASGAGLFAAAPVIERALTTLPGAGSGLIVVSYPVAGAPQLVSDALLALLAITVVLALVRIAPANRGARRRALVLFVPVAAAGLVGTWWSGNYPVPGIAYGAFGRFAPLGLLVAGRPFLVTLLGWAVLLGVPALAFAASLLLVSRYERMLRLIAAGKRAPG
jgi:hypothetical protein